MIKPKQLQLHPSSKTLNRRQTKHQIFNRWQFARCADRNSWDVLLSNPSEVKLQKVTGFQSRERESQSPPPPSKGRACRRCTAVSCVKTQGSSSEGDHQSPNRWRVEAHTRISFKVFHLAELTCTGWCHLYTEGDVGSWGRLAAATSRSLAQHLWRWPGCSHCCVC